MNTTETRCPVVNLEQIEQFRFLGVIIALFDIIVGTCGNLFTILAFTRCKALHTPYNVFIVNLSIIDLLTASCMMPLNLTGYVLKRWPFGPDHISCSLQAFVYFCCGYTSIVCLLAITLNRFVIIIYRDLYIQLFSRRNVLIAASFCWCIAPAFMLPLLIKHNGRRIMTWNKEQYLCTFVPSVMSDWWKNYMLFCRIFFQFMPWFLMSGFYATIFIKVHEQETQMASYNTKMKPLKQSEIYASDDLFLSGGSEPIRQKIGNRLRRLSANFQRSMRRKSKDNVFSAEDVSSNLNSCANFDSVTTGNFESGNSAGTATTTLTTSTTIGSSHLTENYFSQSTASTPGDIGTDGSKRALSPCIEKYVPMSRTITPQVAPRLPKRRADIRLLLCSVTICSVFIILFLPSVVMNLLRGCPDPRLHMAASNLTWLNSCVNPIVYAMMNTRFRKEYIKILRSITRCFRRTRKGCHG